VNENIVLIKNVFKQLQTERPIGIKYAAYKMGENVLRVGKSPFNYIIVPAGELETARIIKENKDLLMKTGRIQTLS
jgi:hypothetical protein